MMYLAKKETKNDIIDRELDLLYKEHNTVTPELVLSAAREKSHALHAFFEWDDKKAAERSRLDTAYRLIQGSKMIYVIERAKNSPPRLVHAQPAEVRRLVPAFKGDGFKMRNEVLDDDEARAAMVDRKKADLRGWCKSVVDISELDEIRKTILGLIE